MWFFRSLIKNKSKNLCRTMDVHKSILGVLRAEGRPEGRPRVVDLDGGHDPGKGLVGRKILLRGIKSR